MACSLTKDEIKVMIRDILLRTVGFAPKTTHIDIIKVTMSTDGSNNIRHVQFAISYSKGSINYDINWDRNEINFIDWNNPFEATTGGWIKFDGRY